MKKSALMLIMTGLIFFPIILQKQCHFIQQESFSIIFTASEAKKYFGNNKQSGK